MNQEFFIGQIFDGIYPPDAAAWCNNNNAYIEDLGDNRYEIKNIEISLPTYEEQSARRADLYRIEVDPITNHIQRLRDAEQTGEIITKITELISERNAKVEEIKNKFPY
jgi:hypothetical protein